MRRINYFRFIVHYKVCLINILVFLFMITLQADTYPQAAAQKSAAQKSAAQKTAEQKQSEDSKVLLAAADDSSGFLKDYKTRIGITAGVSMPMGDLGTALGMGFGADIFADGLLPYSPAENVFLRAGVNLGYYTFSTKNEISASLTTIPFILNCRAIYPVSYGLSPYAGLGLGLTTNMASGDVARSSYDPTVAINFGTEYHHQSIPAVDFFLDMRYMMAFETVTGQFFTVLAGAAYKFDSAGAAPAEKGAETGIK